MEILFVVLLAVSFLISLYVLVNPRGRYSVQATLVLGLVRYAVVAVEQATKGAAFQNLPRDVRNAQRVTMCHEAVAKLAAAYGITLDARLVAAIDVMIEKEVAELPETRSTTINTLGSWLEGVTSNGVVPAAHVTPPADTTHPKQ